MLKDGGPAFPAEYYKDGERKVPHKGMTLRDYFAAKAMQGMFAGRLQGTDGYRAMESYKTADAMLAEKEKNADAT